MAETATPTPVKLTPIRKAAVLLAALEDAAAGAMLSQLPERALEEVTRELATMPPVEQRVRDAVLEEFYKGIVGQQWGCEGGLSRVTALLNAGLPEEKAQQMISSLSQQVRRAPFSFLQKAESSHLLTFIQDEHPQTIALIVSHLSYTKASEVLGGLPGPKQVEVVKRVAGMTNTNPEIVREVEAGLEARLSSMLSQSFEKIGGVGTVAEMLNLTDRTTEKSIMEGLEDESPELVDEIRRLMFVFEDINQVDDKGIQAVLKEVDNDQLTLALKTASEELTEKIFRNMSERAVTMIREEMQFMGPVRVADVEASQQKIVDIVRRLEDAGEIIIQGRGGDKDLIV
ncbi:flagellar motor switch protein FliG [Phycisphaera mikurensis]|uniref:Flagellar motor switch protein FliG n=1 Tax=Phycisphaera mikurensis (strain NBRC 102666 / KCTC 22515 / FYK2301M01) TaxID=1142394 RepID=I0IGE4_PHYMF|nr:flagellar motor switch protein FliG [Phycisphaera mikurensis]MBB6440290.1 flagellar motor switch protein FliG [Phycisphaera mikurensis]BAM04332.1 flagellar motor switch protein FliG [Phycisphaera mikurensis NBRC 102666]